MRYDPGTRGNPPISVAHHIHGILLVVRVVFSTPAPHASPLEQTRGYPCARSSYHIHIAVNKYIPICTRILLAATLTPIRPLMFKWNNITTGDQPDRSGVRTDGTCRHQELRRGHQVRFLITKRLLRAQNRRALIQLLRSPRKRKAADLIGRCLHTLSNLLLDEPK